MARINIEDHFWIEIAAVTKKLKGDESRAVGDAVRLFRLAQQRSKHKQIVTDQDWLIGDFTEALIGIFAFKIEGGYEIAGAKKHFSWLGERIENGRRGGIKSGEVRRNEINTLAEAKRSKVKQTEPSPSPSPSFSITDTDKSVSVPQQTFLEPKEKFKEVSNNSAVSNFDALFAKDSKQWEDVLNEYGLKKRLRLYLGAIRNSFDTPLALKEFIDLKASCDVCIKIMKDCNHDEKKARPRIEQFVLVCLKREIGVMK